MIPKDEAESKAYGPPHVREPMSPVVVNDISTAPVAVDRWHSTSTPIRSRPESAFQASKDAVPTSAQDLLSAASEQVTIIEPIPVQDVDPFPDSTNLPHLDEESFKALGDALCTLLPMTGEASETLVDFPLNFDHDAPLDDYDGGAEILSADDDSGLGTPSKSVQKQKHVDRKLNSLRKVIDLVESRKDADPADRLSQIICSVIS